MKTYLEFEKEVKSLEEELDKLKDPFNKEGISEENTISKSLNLLRSRSNLPGFFHIIIEKNIPTKLKKDRYRTRPRI